MQVEQNLLLLFNRHKCTISSFKQKTNHSKVLHLVSNSFTHPENTASSFKVSYIVPFDLWGRKIALVDATLTKAQDNVLQEKIPFTKSYKTKKHASHLITLPNIEPV